ncbi:MAG TPA: universal stress protein [Flavisolibacter sp.]|nr:universal stress protein [Flavisolibacter sp.]
MEKILVIINAQKPDNATIEFACRIAGFAETRLTGLFIENLYSSHTSNGKSNRSYFSIPEEATAALATDTEQAVFLFREACQRMEIETEVFVQAGEPIQKVIDESRYVDLLIMSPETFYDNKTEQIPSHFVKQVLAHAECPVFLAPQKFEEADEIVFCYDGSPSSVFAIKLFTYLLPQFYNKKVILLEVNKSGSEIFNEGHRRTMEWLRAHYHWVYYQSLKGNVKDELISFFFMKRKKIIVMGAYGRTMISNLLKSSTADALLRSVDLPLFITHH